MIETLTKEQEYNIIPHRDFWLNYILSCKNRTDKEKANRGVEWLYKYSKKEPPIIIWMDSPFGCQVAANYFEKLLSKKDGANIRANIGDNIRANIGANIRDNIWANIGANIGDNIRANIGANIRDNIWANIGANIRDNIGVNIGANIGDNIWANIGVNIGDNIGDNKLKFFQTSPYGNITDYGWVAWVDYFIQNDLIKTDKKEDFECFKELLLSGVFEMIQLDGICFVSDMPTYISRNNSGRLHNTENYSVTFKDGFGQYYINGRYISDDLFLKLKEDKYTIDDFTKESNEEVKSTCIAYLQEVKGDDFIINFFRDNLKEVNTYVDKKESKYLEGTTKGMNVGVYTLFKGNINGVNIAYVRCYCPSTDRMFFLGVNSEHTNAKDAIASLYRVPKKLCNEIKAINRQGERYSTNFTTNGLSLLKSMSKEDIEDLVSISGDNYFKKIEYEY